MRENRERLAWTVLLVSGALFLACAVGVPLGAYEWIQRATLPPIMALQVLEGTPLLEHPGEPPRPVLEQQEPVEVRPGTTIRNEADTEALLTISDPRGTTTLATVQIYPNTQLLISQARSPRYQPSKAAHQLEVTVIMGRVRLGLARETGRDTEFRGRTPHAQFLLWEAGSYSLEVNEQQSEITVREGQATIIAGNGQLSLGELQRGVVGEDGLPAGPLRPERDLITNGHFRQPLEEGWEVRTDAADSSQPAGEVKIVVSGVQEAVRLSRHGLGHAETGIYQLLNQSLNDYQSLHLHLSARLDLQSLGVCGSLGSECPLMVRIIYRDTAGSTRQWVQGFYYWVDPAVPNPTLCETCPPPRQEHEQHSPGAQFFYDSPNLIDMLAQDGRPPASISEIAVYASGHSYDVRVSEIELLVAE